MFYIDIPTKKNLLAFSGGIDSTALFYILVEKNIPFDMVIVNYNQRKESIHEVNYAQSLAQKFGKKCFVQTYPTSVAFNEKNARDFRYSYFDTLIEEFQYDSLMTAHQMNDKLEWFFMQFTKGAGLKELLGMQEKSTRKNYIIYKPLLRYTKQSLIEYLESNQYSYFIDSTNSDQSYLRNYFRHTYCDPLLQKYTQGIQKSFEYLQKDLHSFFPYQTPFCYKELSIYQNPKDDNIALRIIDSDLKSKGIILSAKTREEIVQKKDVVVSHQYAVVINEKFLFISPYCKVTMKKDFKEKCRKLHIPPLIRGYLYSLEDFSFSVLEPLGSLGTGSNCI